MVRRFSFILLLLFFVMMLSNALASETDDMMINSLPEDRLYANPGPIHDIGDPAVLFAKGKFWMFSTSAPNGYRVWSSEDMSDWEDCGMAFQCDPQTSWCTGSFWAPEVYCIDNAYYLFYSAMWYGHGSMRIGIARSETPGGPYVDLKNEPLFDPGFATIDASCFSDEEGKHYLCFSRDCSENVINGIHTSQIYIVPLLPDFSGIDGEPVRVLTPDQPWEYPEGDGFRWNEGPVVVRNNGLYWLFYSANYFESREYGVGAAFAENPLGPYTKFDGSPLLKWVEDAQGETLISGPGHNYCFRVGEEMFTSYHTHYRPYAPSSDRQLAIDRMGFHADGTPFINGPTLAGQFRPLALMRLRNAAPDAQMRAEGMQNPEYLADGDFGFSESSAAYVCMAEADAEIELTWKEPVALDSILLYAPAGQTATGTLILNGEKEICFDFSQIGSVPGSFLSVNVEPVALESLQMIFNNSCSIFEIQVISSDE